MRTILLLMAITASGCRDMNKSQAVPETDTLNSYLLYIGTYTEKEAHVDGKAAGIYVYRMNAETGELTYISVSPFTVNPSFLDISGDGKYLYTVNETGGEKPGQVSAFRLTDHFTHMEFINQVSSHGDYPCYIEADRNGKFVLIANYGTGTVAMIGVGADGSLKQEASVHKHEGKGVTSRQESSHAHCIMASPDGRFIYSNDLGTDKIFLYKNENGDLEPSGIFNAAAGSGPRHLAFHPTKAIVYSINELNGTIDCMHRDTLTGMLKLFQTVSNVTDKNGTEAGSADIHLTPSGEFLYATNRGNYNNIGVFRVDDKTGELIQVDVQSVKGIAPRNFAIDPKGKFLLVANQNSGTVLTFKIDYTTGRLDETGIETIVPTPVCIKFLPEALNH